MAKRKRRAPAYDPNRLDAFLASSPKRLSEGAKKARILSGTHRQTRQWLDRHYTDQHSRCAYCRRTMKRDAATLDHIVPLAKEGLHDIGNTCAACEPCNTLKADLYVEDFLPILEATIEEERKAKEAYWRAKAAEKAVGGP